MDYRDDVTGEEGRISADLVVNATGPWAQRIAEMAGVEVPVRCSPGVLVAVRGRWCDMVVNRLHPSGDGDIVVPQRGLCVIGTSSWVVDDPDELHLPEDHIRTMITEGSRLVPAVGRAELRAAWSAVRPLIGDAGSQTGRELSRTFKCFDHAERDGVEGFVTISGGKATTLRAMAEATADVVCRKLGIDAPCRTREYPLLPHTAYYTSHDAAQHTVRTAVTHLAHGARRGEPTAPAATTEGPSRRLRVRAVEAGLAAARDGRLRGTGRAPHHGARRAAQHPVARRRDPDRAPLVLPLVVRHVRGAGQRRRGARLRHHPGRPALRGDHRRADGQRAGAQRPRGGHDRALRHGSSTPGAR